MQNQDGISESKPLAEYEIRPGLKIIDLFLYFEAESTLVIGDAHLGYEESLNKQGILVPKFQFGEILNRLRRVLRYCRPERTIVVGDVKHEFGTISKEEWRDTMAFFDLLSEYGKIILVKGNHDTILQPMARKKGLQVHDHYLIGDTYFCHGHVLPKDLDFSNAKTVVIGHAHPAVGLRDGPRVEVFKCFLQGEYRGKELLVLPSISSMPEGTDILRENLQSPFLKSISNFNVLIVEDIIYPFGKVSKLAKEAGKRF